MKEPIFFVGINNENQIYAIVGREEIQSKDIDNIKKLPKDLVFISICDPNRKHINTNNHFKDEIKIKFWDVEEQIGEYNPLSQSQSKEIYDFIIKNRKEKFLINCEAGVSRSSGVGLAVEFLLRDRYLYPKWQHFPSKVLSHYRYDPNMTVFNSIIAHDEL